MTMVCKTCSSPARALIEDALIAGHSFRCVSWHLWRLDLFIKHGALERHYVNHMGRTALPNHGPVLVGQRTWHYTPYSTPKPGAESLELLLIRGLPFTGKTRLAKTYGETHSHVEADLFFCTDEGAQHIAVKHFREAHYWCQAWVDRFLHSGHNVVVSNTFSQAEEIAAYCHLAAAAYASVRILEMPDTLPRSIRACQGTRYGVIFQRMLGRIGHYRNRWEPAPLPSTFVTPALQARTIPCIPYACQPGVCGVVEASAGGLSSGSPQKAHTPANQGG